MGVAHQINNPLAIVIANQDYVIAALATLLAGGFAEQRAEAQRPGPPDFMECVAARLAGMTEPLRDAREAADRVRRIVRDLEVFSGPESERGDRWTFITCSPRRSRCWETRSAIMGVS
jgi:hypothetical protein